MKHIIVAIALCISTSAFASKVDACSDFAETTNAMMQLLQEGHSPARILAVFKKHSTRPETMDHLMRLATSFTKDGLKAGPRVTSMLFTVCMDVE